MPAADQQVFEIGIVIGRVADGQVLELWSGMSNLRIVPQLGPAPVSTLGGT